MIILLKSNNQRLIALAQNLVFYFKIKYIDIQHYYIHNKVVSWRIKSSYILTKKMIVDSLIKTPTYIKFHHIIKQINIT